jgi:hypothetical protein
MAFNLDDLVAEVTQGQDSTATVTVADSAASEAKSKSGDQE